jgi:hypothetical protein
MPDKLIKILQFNIDKRVKNFYEAVNNPVERQQAILHSLLLKAKNTEIGKKKLFPEIKDHAEYSRRLEICDYNIYQPIIERITKGESDVLWPGKIDWFAKSSGTSENKSKYIPITHDALQECHYKAGKDLLALVYKNRPDINIHKGYGVSLGGSLRNNPYRNDSYIGDLSAVLIRNFPFWVKFWQQPGRDISLLEDWEIKIDKIAESTINKRITNITGVPTWTTVLIKRILEITGKSNIKEVWPHLEVYIHGGVSFDPYRDLYARMIQDPDFLYMENYNASEGFFGIQDHFKQQDMMLLIDHGIFYEFIPMNEFGKSDQKAVALEDIELNKNYALVISTNTGLWRYLIGDTVKFTSKFPFRFRITGRTKSFINAFGEELIVDNVEKAIVEACLHTQAQINDYTVAPVYFSDSSSGTHEWMIEFSREPDDLVKFSRILDNRLKELNSDYEAKRHKDIALTFPIVNKVEQGSFYHWMKQIGKLGGQNKVPRLYNNRMYVDDLKNFLKME